MRSLLGAVLALAAASCLVRGAVSPSRELTVTAARLIDTSGWVDVQGFTLPTGLQDGGERSPAAAADEAPLPSGRRQPASTGAFLSGL